MSENFKSLSLYLKEQFYELDYGDFFPKLNQAKLKELLKDCAFWEEYKPHNHTEYPNNILFIKLKTTEYKIAFECYEKSIKLSIFENDIVFSKDEIEEDKKIEVFDFGLNHKKLYKELYKTFKNLLSQHQ